VEDNFTCEVLLHFADFFFFLFSKSEIIILKPKFLVKKWSRLFTSRLYLLL